jgi:hypothetical protein
MPISNQEAAEVARRHGLSLQDAVALARLSDNVKEGDQLAEMFTTPSVPQIGRDALKTMSPEQIETARVEGRLKNILGQGGDQ